MRLLMSCADRQMDQLILTTPVFSQYDDSMENLAEICPIEGEISRSDNTSPITPQVTLTDNDENLRIISRTISFSTPKDQEHSNAVSVDTKRGLIIPIFTYDCSLALLIDSLVEKHKKPRFKDIYRDHTYRLGEQPREDFVHLKPEDSNQGKPASPDPKSEDSDQTTGGKLVIYRCIWIFRVKNQYLSGLTIDSTEKNP